jgi:hypothetical protein
MQFVVCIYANIEKKKDKIKRFVLNNELLFSKLSTPATFDVCSRHSISLSMMRLRV